MRNGEPVDGIAFFELLSDDAQFCQELGRAVLAASRLETELKNYLTANGVGQDTKKATLGQLIELAQKCELLKRALPAFEMLKLQRNYLTHNVHPLFASMIEETILPRTDLLDSDIDMFTERARQLAENLNGVADALISMAKAPNSNSSRPPAAAAE